MKNFWQRGFLGGGVLLSPLLFATETAAGPVPFLVLQDSVNAGMKLRIDRALDIAEATHAPAVFIELDTPGGYLDVTREIVKSFLKSKTPIIVYVSPQGSHAASAGAMITMAAHFAAMAPSTSIGAATPVTSSGGDIGGDMKKKVTNDTVAFVEGIAEKRGRDPTFARECVTLAVSLNATDAAKKRVVDGVFATRDEVWAAAHKKFPDLPGHVNFTTVEISLKEKAISLLSNPNVAFGLMALGGLGIYIEMHTPGVIVPGLLGVVSLALGSISMQIIPIQTSAIVFLILGMIFLGIEIVTPLPTYGVAGAGALVLFLLSGIFLMDESKATIHLDPGVWFPIFAVLCAAVGALSYFAFKALKSKPSLVQGAGGMVGLDARVTRVHADHLSLGVIGEIWSGFPVTGEAADFKIGDTVEIVSQEGLKVFFRKKEKKEFS